MTNDIDLVINMKSDDVETFAEAFPIEDFYCPPPEAIRLEIGRSQRGHFNLIHHETGFKADIYASGRDELHHWGLEKRKSVDVEGEKFWLAPIEYVILRKLEYYREGKSEKHMRDISSMLALSADEIDLKILEERIISRNLKKEWKTVQNFKI
ncbi:MAG: hypothetical protein WBM69_16655 [Desulfobacterales bacterium]